jgi:nucleoside-specific outer membrane channel protein Tsx
MSRFLTASLLAGGALACAQASAADLLQWQNNSVSYLYGKDYKVDSPIQQTVTLEHVSGWSFGDVFLFVDSIHFNGKGNLDKNGGFDESTYYGEFAPRLSFGKLSGADLKAGPVTDVLLAATYEFGENDTKAYLIGPGFDLAIPGFDYFQLNVYRRHLESDADGDGLWQITPVWSYTLPVGSSDLVIDGYIDWVVGNDGEYRNNLHFNPQIKYDLGKALNLSAKQLYVGVEYDFWKNKYGIEEGGPLTPIVGRSDQNTASLLVKLHF